MKFASFQIDDRNSWGLVGPNVIHNLGAAFPDMKSAIGQLGSLDRSMAGPAIPLEKIRWMPVIPNPDKIICVGLNYEMHRKETGRSSVSHPTIFTRFANSQVGHLEGLVKPRLSNELDYEGELAIVIGWAGRHIDRSQAMQHVAGFSCYNDASVRDFQRHTMQFTPGKNFPGTGAFGPWLVTPDEVGELADLRISTVVNGQTLQDARLGEMIFDIPSLIAYCSSFTRLEPGDVIVTGTPAGIGSRRTPPLWLSAGDKVDVVIDRVGTLSNRVIEEAE